MSDPRTVVNPDGISPELAATIRRLLDASPEFAAWYRRVDQLLALEIGLSPDDVADLAADAGR